MGLKHMNLLVQRQVAICKKKMKVCISAIVIFWGVITNVVASTVDLHFPIEPTTISYEYQIKDWKKILNVVIELDEKKRIVSLNMQLDGKKIISDKMFDIIQSGSPYYKDVGLSAIKSKNMGSTERLVVSIGLNSGDGLKDVVDREEDRSRALIFEIVKNGSVSIEYIEINKEKVMREKLY